MFSTLTRVYRDHGVTRGLYRGMSINYMRAIPMVAVSFSTYELCKQIMDLDTGLKITGEHLYSGIAHAASTIFKEEGGIRALYRGFVPTLMGMVPYAGLSFYCFEYLKFGCMKYLPRLTSRPCDKNTGGLVLTVPAKLLAMMNPDTHHFAKGMFSTLTRVYRDHGVTRGLYRGMSINYMRAIPMVAVSFSTYELCKQIMDLDTGLKV
ncbi:hypothetical protein NQ318_023034 [Aromia moschata]|uniref:Graves disease carrier protein n=1 Tax=Aromia moschata TaxID=1265417 RepID=A0AAV8XYC5_9CUCU|nr:hypothetical protein NQ318_023034 [Aromia moschata]